MLQVAQFSSGEDHNPGEEGEEVVRGAGGGGRNVTFLHHIKGRRRVERPLRAQCCVSGSSSLESVRIIIRTGTQEVQQHGDRRSATAGESDEGVQEGPGKLKLKEGT